MGIWNTTASPIGYAYQSAKGSGINVKLDPRIYQTDNGDYPRQSRSSGESESGFKNKDVLDGTNEQLYDLANQIDNEIHKLEVDFNRNIISEKNADKSLQMQKDYANQMNILSSRKQSLFVTNQNAKFEYDKYQTARSEVSKNDIGSEIALANPLAGTITRGDDLLGMIASGKNPYQIVLEKDKKTGKYYGDVLTNNKYLDYYNQHSGLTQDESGRIVPTIFNAPVTKMNNFMVTKKEIEEKIDKTVANNIVNSIDKEVNGGQAKYHLKTNSNISSIKTGINTAWESLSEGSRSYMLSNVINGDIHIDDGTKEGKWMSGKSAVLKVEKNMIDMRSDKTTKEEKEKLLNESKTITDAIVNTAKINVHNIAAGRAYGQYNFSKDESLMPNRNAAGDIIGAKKMSRIEQVEAGMTNAESTPMFWRSPSTGKENLFVGRTNDKAKSLTTDEQNLYAPEILKQGKPDTGMFGYLSEQPIAIINGVAVNPKVLFNNKNNQIVSIGSEIRSLPSYEMVPVKGKYMFNGQPTVFTNLNMIDLKKSYMDTYLKVTVKLDEDANVPDMKVNGVPTFIKYKDLTKQQKQQMGYSEEDETISMYIKSPSITSSGGNNTVSDYNLNVAESQAQMGDNIAFTKQLREYSISKYKEKQSEDLKTLITNNPGAKYVTPDNKVIFGETEEEQIKSIQSTSNLDNRTEQEKYEMTKPILYRMRASESITEEQYNKLLKKLEDNKPKEDRSKWSILQQVNEVPFDIYRSLNDTGNEIINQVIN